MSPNWCLSREREKTQARLSGAYLIPGSQFLQLLFNLLSPLAECLPCACTRLGMTSSQVVRRHCSASHLKFPVRERGEAGAPELTNSGHLPPGVFASEQSQVRLLETEKRQEAEEELLQRRRAQPLGPSCLACVVFGDSSVFSILSSEKLNPFRGKPESCATKT